MHYTFMERILMEIQDARWVLSQISGEIAKLCEYLEGPTFQSETTVQVQDVIDRIQRARKLSYAEFGLRPNYWSEYHPCHHAEITLKGDCIEWRSSLHMGAGGRQRGNLTGLIIELQSLGIQKFAFVNKSTS